MNASVQQKFFAAQSAFVAYVVLEVVLATVFKLPATERTASLSMKGDTAVTAPWIMTIIWAVLVLVAYRVRARLARAGLIVLATFYAASISAGNSQEIFAATPQFTGARWGAVIGLDSIAALFTVACLVCAIAWAIQSSDRPATGNVPRRLSGPVASRPDVEPELAPTKVVGSR